MSKDQECVERWGMMILSSVCWFRSPHFNVWLSRSYSGIVIMVLQALEIEPSRLEGME